MTLLIYGRAAQYEEVALSLSSTLKKGCFSKHLGTRGISMLLHHDEKSPAGYWSDVWEHGNSIYVLGKITEDQACAMVEDGALSGLSVGYTDVLKSTDHYKREFVLEGDIYEISLTPIPASKRTSLFITHKPLTRRQVEWRMKRHDESPMFPKDK